MNRSEARREHLQKVTAWADKARVELGTVQQEHAGMVHFRPASRGVAMVGLLSERPQRAKSGIRDLAGLRHEFEQQFQRDCVDVNQGRPTPEARLQSWIIADAYRHEREIRALNAGADNKLLFVADELPLVADDGAKIVCDLLAFRATDAESGVPVIIELKWARHRKRLIEQVVGYADLVDEHAREFEALFGAVLGRAVHFNAPSERWVVWPADTRRPDRRASEFREHGIILVGFEEEMDGYGFVVD